jgi:hypothetical protein
MPQGARAAPPFLPASCPRPRPARQGRGRMVIRLACLRKISSIMSLPCRDFVPLWWQPGPTPAVTVPGISAASVITLGTSSEYMAPARRRSRKTPGTAPAPPCASLRSSGETAPARPAWQWGATAAVCRCCRAGDRSVACADRRSNRYTPLLGAPTACRAPPQGQQTPRGSHTPRDGRGHTAQGLMRQRHQRREPFGRRQVTHPLAVLSALRNRKLAADFGHRPPQP